MSILALVLVSLVASESQTAEDKLVHARELFQQNRWAEARAELSSDLGSLPDSARTQAQFLLGLSYVKEAELYRSLHRFAVDVGIDYLFELAASEDNADIVWLPLFTGIYQLEAGLDEKAERSLAKAASSKELPAEWRELANRRRAVAQHRLGRGPANAAQDEEPNLDRLDEPDIEDDTDPQKTLRFFDPSKLKALEHAAWNHAVADLRPLAGTGDGFASKLASYNAGLSLLFLGDEAGAESLLASLDAAALGPAYHSRVTLLRAAAGWKREPPSETELASLWAATQTYPETVLLWKDLETPKLSSLEPFRSKLATRLTDLPATLGERADKSLVGRWGLAELESDTDPAVVVRTLSEFRNHANKNKIEWNDPVFLTALSAANYRNSDYAQSLETLFELAKTFPGLRGLQWNLQGIYAQRQKSAGDARITN